MTDKEWADEFDRRVASGQYRTDKMDNFLNPFRPTEIRVEDDAGTMRRRNGDGCCGCGKWSSETYTADPEWRPHHHEDGTHSGGGTSSTDGDDEPRGYFCSWL